MRPAISYPIIATGTYSHDIATFMNFAASTHLNPPYLVHTPTPEYCLLQIENVFCTCSPPSLRVSRVNHPCQPAHSSLWSCWRWQSPQVRLLCHCSALAGSLSHVVRWSSDSLSNPDCTDGLYTEAASGPRSHRKALRAPPPANGNAISIKGRRADSANTMTINGRACVSQYVTSWDNMCNSSSHPEGHVCANASKSYEHYCSYDVGPTTCARCKDWEALGPKCLEPEVTISQGLCSGRTWSISSCQLESVSVDWAGSQLAKHLGEWETAEECAWWTQSLCDFVGGTVKTDACAPGSPYCDAMDDWWDSCHSDAYCAQVVLDEAKWCCSTEAPKMESWSAKLCDGATVKGQALVPRNYVLA